MKKNDIIELAITDIATDGQGIGRYEDMAVFVSGALPGETVRARLITLKRNHAAGKMIDIIAPSPARAKPSCPVFSQCGGCALQHLSYVSQLEYKQNRIRECMARIAGLDIHVEFPLPCSAEHRYRSKAAFPVRMQDGRADIGMYRKHTHTVVDVADCLIQRSDVAIAISQLRVWITKYNIRIYDEAAHTGLLRHIVIRVSHTGEMMLVLVINGESIPCQRELFMLFRLVLPQVRSIVLNHNVKNTNVIMGDTNTVLLGRGYYFETICGIEYKINPQTFLQVNFTQMEALYNNLFKRLALHGHEIVLDLFCGIGTITLNAARRAKHVYGIELSEASIADAQFNGRLNDIENVSFFAGDANTITRTLLAELKRVDAVILDPPRKGISRELIQDIASASPGRIAYISCDPATLARDLAIFNQSGYSVSQIQPVDMFPQTTHIECLTILDKK